MLEHLSKKFVKNLITNGIIYESESDVYEYGFFQTVMMILNILTTLFLGIIFELLIPCILLNLSYIPIRINAGGHHAETPKRCYISSTIMITVLLSVIKWVQISPIVCFFSVVLSLIIILILAPEETENNPYDEQEKRVYRKRIKLILVIETAVFTFGLIFNLNQIYETVMLGLFAESLMLIMGKREIKQKTLHNDL